MSLLMDALRRAEAATASADVDDEQAPAAPAQIDLPASNSPLQLEPLESQLPEALSAVTTANETHGAEGPPSPEVATESAAPQRQAQSALGAFADRKSAARKHILFVGTGLMTAAVVLTGYYFWTSRDLAAGAVPAAATLIETSHAATAPDTHDALTEPAATAPAAAAQPLTATQGAPAEPEDTALTAPAPTPFVAAEKTEPAPLPYQIEIHKNRQPVTVPPALRRAYQAYRDQAYERAEQLYREVLQRYPANRDAMLGLAAIAVHQGNRQVARHYYDRLLKADPADRAALLAKQGLSTEHYSLENGSKIKYWLQTDGDNAQLHFALGNQYAASGQWKEAQQAYFDAHRIEPANADYAYNLGVSLDQLGLVSQALEYYRQARSLAEKGGALFSVQQLDRRIVQLTAAMERRG